MYPRSLQCTFMSTTCSTIYVIFLSTFYIFTFLDFFVMKMSNSWKVILHRSTFNCHVQNDYIPLSILVVRNEQLTAAYLVSI